MKEIENLQTNNFIETINLDVQRTPFENDIEKNRKAIFNILKALAYTKPQINYCQGMNYIAAFILEYIGNEEEAFYLFYSILCRTEYGEIFLNDLTRLKQFFYVFDRLMFINLPELHTYFKNNSIIVSYFLSPWFITMFTNCFQYIKEADNPKIIIRILDEFFLVYNFFNILIEWLEKYY